jgi:putative endonuclease
MGRLHQFADALRHRARLRRERPEMAAGKRGEDIAHRFLQRAGIVIVARNFRTANGSAELDLIGWEKDTLVVIEVKSRTTEEYGSPERAMSPEKEKAVVRAAREYARHAEIPLENVRFDVVSVVFGTPPQVRHQRDAFRP